MKSVKLLFVFILFSTASFATVYEGGPGKAYENIKANVVVENSIFLKNNPSSYSLYTWGTNNNITGINNWFSESIKHKDVFTNNLTGTEPCFINTAENNYKLTGTSPCVDVIGNYVTPGETELESQYLKYLGSEPRADDGILDLGAYEFDSGNSINYHYNQKEFSLTQNSPNPFNPMTTITYNVMKSGNVELTIYSILGQKLKKLANTRQNAENYSVLWDSTNESGKIIK